MKHQLDTLSLMDTTNDLIAMLAHDLRGSVTSIKGFSQLALRQYPTAPPLREYLQAVVNESNRVAALLDDLVLVTHYESEPSQLRPGPTELGGLISMAAQRSHELYSSRQIEFEPISTALPVWCDSHVAVRALVRLISTLLRYCSETQPVTLTATRGVEGPIIGISAFSQNAASRFAALQRAAGIHTTTIPHDERLSASGLGLYLGRRLIELQGGRVWIQQSLEAGVQFVVALPEHR